MTKSMDQKFQAWPSGIRQQLRGVTHVVSSDALTSRAQEYVATDAEQAAGRRRV